MMWEVLWTGCIARRLFYSSVALDQFSRTPALSACQQHSYFMRTMTVLIKNLFTVHILIWLTQIRHQHYLWWRSKARLDTARRMISVSALGIMAKSSVENSFPFNARVCTLNRQPPPNTTQTHPTPTTHCCKTMSNYQIHTYVQTRWMNIGATCIHTNSMQEMTWINKDA